MDKFEQITYLAEAALLIRQVLQECKPEFKDALQSIADDVADIADQIEES